jgi:hypothetical protein
MLASLVEAIHIRPGAHNRAFIASQLALRAHGDSVLGAHLEATHLNDS